MRKHRRKMQKLNGTLPMKKKFENRYGMTIEQAKKLVVKELMKKGDNSNGEVKRD